MNEYSLLKKAIVINDKKIKNSYKNRLKKNKIAIMGGTFNPIHLGHLATAEAVRTTYDIDKIIFIPSGVPPHKLNLHNIDKVHRYNMTVLATLSNRYFEVSSLEMDRMGNSYTVDTLKKIKNIYKNSQIFFITGADALCEIDKWKNIDENFKVATFIGTTRPGVKSNNVRDKIDILKKKYNANILDIHVPSLDISSTDLREKIKNKESIKYLLPESVERYIYKNELYR